VLSSRCSTTVYTSYSHWWYGQRVQADFGKKTLSVHGKKTALRVQFSRTRNNIVQSVRAYAHKLPYTLSYCDVGTAAPAAAHYTLYPSPYALSNSWRRRTVRRCNERILHTHYKRSISHARAKIRRIIIPLDRGDVQIILYYIIIRVFVVCASDARVYVCVCACVCSTSDKKNTSHCTMSTTEKPLHLQHTLTIMCLYIYNTLYVIYILLLSSSSRVPLAHKW